MRLLAILFAFSLSTTAFSQIDSIAGDSFDYVNGSIQRDYGIKLGFHGGHHMFGELSLFSELRTEMGAILFFTNGYNVGMEFSYLNGPIIAPKVGWRAEFVVFQIGASALWFTDLNSHAAFAFKPEIGIGLPEFELVYGYNWKLYDEGLGNLNTHTLSLRINLRLHSKPIASSYGGYGWYRHNEDGTLTKYD